MTHLFFRQKNTDPEWRKTKKCLFCCWNLVVYGLLCGMLGIISLVLSVGSYQIEISISTIKTPVLLFYNVLPVIAMGLMLYALIGRGYWAMALTRRTKVCGPPPEVISTMMTGITSISTTR